MSYQDKAASETKIVRVVSVRDTRAFEDTDFGMRPIPGSGDARSCDRCGRVHEVHAVVELANGARQTVGTGCMKADDAEIARALAAGARSATTRAKNRSRARRLIAGLRAMDAATLAAANAATPAPTDEVHEWNKRDGLRMAGWVSTPAGSIMASTWVPMAESLAGAGVSVRAATIRHCAECWRSVVRREWLKLNGFGSLTHETRGATERKLRALLAKR